MSAFRRYAYIFADGKRGDIGAREFCEIELDMLILIDIGFTFLASGLHFGGG